MERFCDLYATGALAEFHSIGDTIIAWADHILARRSNCRIEGTHDLPQVRRRVTHGFTKTDNFAARGLLLT